MIKSSPTGQAVQALSCGEAEYVACVKGASLGLGCASMCEDFGMPRPTIILESDSAAAKGICSRIGLGRIRHLSTTLLWLQGYIETSLVPTVVMFSAALGLARSIVNFKCCSIDSAQGSLDTAHSTHAARFVQALERGGGTFSQISSFHNRMFRP